jgi:hypothetical protein
MIIRAPTNAGKSLVVQLLMVRDGVLSRRGRTACYSLLMLPYRSLVDEMETKLVAIVRNLQDAVRALQPAVREANARLVRSVEGVRVSCFYRAVGGRFPDASIRDGILIATLERAAGLLQEAAGLGRLSDVRSVLLDEVQFIGDQKRGAMLEATLAKIQWHGERMPVYGFSATLPDVSAQHLAAWLRGTVYTVDEGVRPVTLHRSIAAYRGPGQVRLHACTPDAPHGVVRLGCPSWQARPEQGLFAASERREIELFVGLQTYLAHLWSTRGRSTSTIVFVRTKRLSETFAGAMGAFARRFDAAAAADEAASRKRRRDDDATEEDAEPTSSPADAAKADVRARLISHFAVGSPVRDTQRVAIEHGICFHHAGLKALAEGLSEAVTAAFLDNSVSLLFATTTLAAGVNMPAEVVVVAGLSFGRVTDIVSPGRLTQMLGRAGRLGRITSQHGGLGLVMVPHTQVEMAQELATISPEPANSHLCRTQSWQSLGSLLLYYMYALVMQSHGLALDADLTPQVWSSILTRGLMFSINSFDALLRCTYALHSHDQDMEILRRAAIRSLNQLARAELVRERMEPATPSSSQTSAAATSPPPLPDADAESSDEWYLLAAADNGTSDPPSDGEREDTDQLFLAAAALASEAATAEPSYDDDDCDDDIFLAAAADGGGGGRGEGEGGDENEENDDDDDDVDDLELLAALEEATNDDEQDETDDDGGWDDDMFLTAGELTDPVAAMSQEAVAEEETAAGEGDAEQSVDEPSTPSAAAPAAPNLTPHWFLTRIGVACARASLAPQRAATLWKGAESSVGSLYLRSELHVLYVCLVDFSRAFPGLFGQEAIRAVDATVNRVAEWLAVAEISRSVSVSSSQPVSVPQPPEDGQSPADNTFPPLLQAAVTEIAAAAPVIRFMPTSSRDVRRILFAAALLHVLNEENRTEILESFFLPRRTKKSEIVMKELSKGLEELITDVAYVAAEYGRLFSSSHERRLVSTLFESVSSRLSTGGSRAELEPLLDIKFVSVARARALYRNPRLRSVAAVASAEIDEVVKALGRTAGHAPTATARKIVESANNIIRFSLTSGRS